MKALFSSLALLVIGLCVGIGIGYHAAPPATAPVKAVAAPVPKKAALPVVDDSTNAATNSAAKKLSPADIPAAFTLAVKKFQAHGDETAMKDFLQSIDPADLPQVIALAEKLPAFQTRQQVRNVLLAHWAETDLKAAMTAADAITNLDSRIQAVVAVVGAWAQKDPVAAAAWVK
jgi:hypothetical protein